MNNFTKWTEDICKELVIRYYSQGGTDYNCFHTFMTPRYEKVLAELGEQLDEIHKKSFKIE